MDQSACSSAGCVSSTGSAAVTSPLGQRTSTVYDAAGRAVARLNPLAQRTTTAYDAAGRITSMLVAGAPGGPSALHRFTYDTLGRVTFATDPDIGDRHLVYDDGDHLVSHSNGANKR